MNDKSALKTICQLRYSAFDELNNFSSIFVNSIILIHYCSHVIYNTDLCLAVKEKGKVQTL